MAPGCQMVCRMTMLGVTWIPTDAWSIPPPNAMMIDVSSDTLSSRSAGRVAMMYGFAHAVMNVNGFGTASGTAPVKGCPLVSVPSAELISIVYRMHSVNGVECGNVTVSFVGVFQESDRPARDGLIEYWRLPVFIRSLNRTTIGAVGKTSIWPWRGSVSAMYGRCA